MTATPSQQPQQFELVEDFAFCMDGEKSLPRYTKGDLKVLQTSLRGYIFINVRDEQDRKRICENPFTIEKRRNQRFVAHVRDNALEEGTAFFTTVGKLTQREWTLLDLQTVQEIRAYKKLNGLTKHTRVLFAELDVRYHAILDVNKKGVVTSSRYNPDFKFSHVYN